MKAIRNVIIFSLIVAALVLGIKACMYKNPVTAEQFAIHMNSNNFTVIDSLIDEDGNLAVDDRGIVTYYKATNLSDKVYVDFKVYENDIYADDEFKKLVNAKKLMVYNKDPLYYDFTKDQNFVTVSSGPNYSRYYTRDIDNNYTIISRIENTLLYAKIDLDDKRFTESVILKINY